MPHKWTVLVLHYVLNFIFKSGLAFTYIYVRFDFYLNIAFKRNRCVCLKMFIKIRTEQNIRIFKVIVVIFLQWVVVEKLWAINILPVVDVVFKKCWNQELK